MKLRTCFAGLCALLLSFVTLSAAEEPIKVACIGDSITEGIGAERGKSYPDQLQALLGEKYKVGNFGVSARTNLQKGYPYRKHHRYQEALKMLPNIVIIMLGTNDSKPQNWQHEAEFVGDYRDLIKSFQELPSKPKVYVCRPCPVPGKGNFGINEENVLKIIERLGPLIKELDCGMIDMHAALLEKAAMLPDRVHPNTAGAGEMAKAAAKAITSK
jgi:acyl-CoA thioesterase I